MNGARGFSFREFFMRPDERAAADALWRAHPQLAYSFLDLAAFREAYAASRCVPDAARMAEAVTAGKIFAGEIAMGAQLAAAMSAPGAVPTALIPYHRLGARLVLNMYGPFNQFWSADARSGISAGWVSEALACNADAAVVVLRIASAGGHIAQCWSVIKALRSHRGRKVAVIDHMAFSAAAIVAAACDEVVVRRSASLMVHEASGYCFGNAHQMQSEAQVLQMQGRQLRRFLLGSRPRLKARELERVLRREIILSAAEAVRIGLADRITRDVPRPADCIPRDWLAVEAPVRQ